ncbi:hypothetical protein IWZ00DRAFT_490436 [Phyllosticta capitalensis]
MTPPGHGHTLNSLDPFFFTTDIATSSPITPHSTSAAIIVQVLRLQLSPFAYRSTETVPPAAGSSSKNTPAFIAGPAGPASPAAAQMDKKAHALAELAAIKQRKKQKSVEKRARSVEKRARRRASRVAAALDKEADAIAELARIKQKKKQKNAETAVARLEAKMENFNMGGSLLNESPAVKEDKEYLFTHAQNPKSLTPYKIPKCPLPPAQRAHQKFLEREARRAQKAAEAAEAGEGEVRGDVGGGNNRVKKPKRPGPDIRKALKAAAAAEASKDDNSIKEQLQQLLNEEEAENVSLKAQLAASEVQVATLKSELPRRKTDVPVEGCSKSHGTT